MELWLKLSLLLASVAISLIILIAVVPYKTFRQKTSRPRYIDIEERVSSDVFSDSPPPFNSWTNSWTWLRRNSKGSQSVSISNSESEPAPVDPLSPTTLVVVHEPPTKDVSAGRDNQYNTLDVDLERGLPEDIFPLFDKNKKQRQRGRIEYTIHQPKKNERTPLLPRSRSVSPYKPTFPPGLGGSEPIDIPKKKTDRPTFPLPQKLIWQKLTPFEKAGMVWYRN